jgi:hypothetical protein
LTIVFYISGHGFGHATRELEIVRHLHEMDPRVRIVVRSAVPAWFLQSAGAAIEAQPCEADTGVTQIDSLRLDEAATVRHAKRFYASFESRVAEEADAIRRLGASMAVGDVPPLAFAAAARAHIPSVAVANFTWDWIYAAYPAFQEEARDVLTLIGQAYASTTLALRLPFAGGFATMPRVRDVPLVARRSRRSRADTRRLLKLEGGRPVVLASFGGHGALLPFDRIAAANDITLVATDYETAETSDEARAGGRLRCLTSAFLQQAGIRYEDLVAAADVVVSKPGYGIVSECIVNQAALLYTSRGFFAENDALVGGMQPVLRSRFISQEDLWAGRWGPAIRDLLSAPEPPERMETGGAGVVATAILDEARRVFSPSSA